MSREIGLSKELIDGIYWITLTCTLPICPDKFKLHCDYVLGLYNQEMTKEIVTGMKRKRIRREVWYPPSQTLHKILFHRANVIRLIPRTLMLGQLSQVNNLNIGAYVFWYTYQKNTLGTKKVNRNTYVKVL